MTGTSELSDEALSVSEAVAAAKGAVASVGTFLVTGEVSGFRGPNARSGHCYFEVKDDVSSMSVIVWRGVYAASGIQLKDGMELLMKGKFDVYQGSGRLSFIASRIMVSGEGLLRQQVAALARKLEREGLMDPSRKRPIPRFCTRVAVVTSLSGSVIEDVRRTLKRRNPLVELQMVGASVQGPEAPRTMVRALKIAAAAKPDAILLVRGGGSFEDLMAFNDEGLARAVAACPVPVITGIGHEPDTSICDMVADRRCSTPTAAAESVAPALDEIVTTLNERQVRLGRAFGTTLEREGEKLSHAEQLMSSAMTGRLGREQVHLESLAKHRCFTDPMSFIEDRRSQLELSEQRLHDAIPHALERQENDLSHMVVRLTGAATRMLVPYEAEVKRAAATLDALSPLKVLGRGYAIAKDKDGHVVSDAEKLSPGDELNVMLGHGTVTTEVKGVDVSAQTR